MLDLASLLDQEAEHSLRVFIVRDRVGNLKVVKAGHARTVSAAGVRRHFVHSKVPGLTLETRSCEPAAHFGAISVEGSRAA
jgi:hypothetical protein